MKTKGEKLAERLGLSHFVDLDLCNEITRRIKRTGRNNEEKLLLAVSLLAGDWDLIGGNKLVNRKGEVVSILEE